MNKIEIDKFRKRVDSLFANSSIPGLAYSIVGEKGVIYAEGLGARKEGSRLQVNENTVFQIGSITKSFTAALLAILVDKQKLKWDSKVIDILPEFRMSDPWVTREITIRDILIHCSGLPERSGTMQAFLGYSRGEVIHNIRHINPVTSFRSSFAYQNGMYLVAATIAEKIAGKSWERLIKQYLFYPLKMKNSSTSIQEFLSEKNKAWLHHINNTGMHSIPRNWQYMNWVDVFGPAGGINSNVIDLANWIRLQINTGVYGKRRIISQKEMEYIHRPHIYVAECFRSSNYYGLGWLRQQSDSLPDIVWHDGGTTGARSSVAFMPSKKIGIVVLVNASDFVHAKECMLPHIISWSFFDFLLERPEKSWEKLVKKAVQPMLDGRRGISKMHRKASKEQSASLSLAEYAGNYHNSIYGTITIKKQQNRLCCTIGPKKTKLLLKHKFRDTFNLIWPQTLDENESTAAFNLGNTNTPVDVIINAYGSDTCFKRVD